MENERVYERYPAQAIPNMVPKIQYGLQVTDVQVLEPLLFCYIYIWLVDRTAFWLYPISITATMVVGYLWQNNQWVLQTIEGSRIEAYY